MFLFYISFVNIIIYILGDSSSTVKELAKVKADTVRDKISEEKNSKED
jgi:hypothetical protein